jgi:transcriptional regulator with XRE-family HTH domain
MDSLKMSQADLAKKLGVTESAVSQTINGGGCAQLNTVIKYAQAVGLKVSLVAYDDGDSGNQRGPVDSKIFEACWNTKNKPTDFFELNEVAVGDFVKRIIPRIESGEVPPDIATDAAGQIYDAAEKAEQAAD